MELLDGGELFQELVERNTGFNENDTRNIMKQVGEAVRYLHENCGIVHRDIKLENLLCSKSLDCIKLADFGLSKVIWSGETTTPCGTVGYCAPEIVNVEKYSKSVDLWAIGCVLYTLVVGFPPFYDEDVPELTRKVARGEFTFLRPWWDDKSVECKHLITKLLTTDVASRLDINGFFDHPWIKGEKLSKEQIQEWKYWQKHHRHRIDSSSASEQNSYPTPERKRSTAAERTRAAAPSVWQEWSIPEHLKTPMGSPPTCLLPQQQHLQSSDSSSDDDEHMHDLSPLAPPMLVEFGAEPLKTPLEKNVVNASYAIYRDLNSGREESGGKGRDRDDEEEEEEEEEEFNVPMQLPKSLFDFKLNLSNSTLLKKRANGGST